MPPPRAAPAQPCTAVCGRRIARGLSVWLLAMLALLALLASPVVPVPAGTGPWDNELTLRAPRDVPA